jgi:hypothetical protein
MRKIFALLSLVSLLLSCQPKQEKKSQASVVYNAEREIFYNYLTNRMATFDQLAPGLMSFKATLLNNPERVFDYMNQDVKAAANVGIYMADLYYCILSNENKVSENYFKAVVELSKVLGVEKNQVDDLLVRYNKNLENHDSIKSIATQLLKHSTLDLGTEQERLAGIVMSTYQIENLYLALSILLAYPENPSPAELQTQQVLQTQILAQRRGIEIIYNFLRSVSDPLDPQQNPNYPFYDNALRELIGIYQSLNTEKQQETTTVISSNTKLMLIDLKDKVTEIRSKIVIKQ